MSRVIPRIIIEDCYDCPFKTERDNHQTGKSNELFCINIGVYIEDDIKDNRIHPECNLKKWKDKNND